MHVGQLLALDGQTALVTGGSPGNIPVPTSKKIHSGEMPPLWPVN